MYLLGIGIVLLALKYFDIAPVTAMPWWQVLLPFGLAVLWWHFADSTGYTKRKAMEKEQKRTTDRKNKQRDALGLGLKPPPK
jgi:small Trp-rich protein